MNKQLRKKTEENQLLKTKERAAKLKNSINEINTRGLTVYCNEPIDGK